VPQIQIKQISVFQRRQTSQAFSAGQFYYYFLTDPTLLLIAPTKIMASQPPTLSDSQDFVVLFPFSAFEKEED